MNTFTLKPADIKREWVLIDASDQVLGRLATKIANILRGKNKPTFCHHMDTGDFVVVINAEKIRLTGNKAEAKKYYRHSGYPGGLKTIDYKVMLEKHPDRIITKAVKGMLPKNKLSNQLLTKLRVFSGPNHRHAAQQPRPIQL